MTWCRGTAAAIVATVGLSSACAGGTSAPRAQPEPVATSATTSATSPTTTPTPSLPHGRPPAWHDLLGAWRPVVLDGRRVPGLVRLNDAPLLIHFRELGLGHSWDGYDGCNWTSGRIRLRPSGLFRIVDPVTTLRACGPVRHPLQWDTTKITEGHRLLLHHRRLLVLDEDGRVLASYVRSTAHR